MQPGNEEKATPLDSEWLYLMWTANQLGLTPSDVRKAMLDLRKDSVLTEGCALL